MSTTSPLDDPSRAEAENAISQTATPRKRRRRAPASGAADDCFACQERGSKCDRRRPYCSPCLDLGRDCSGYKTALTWGVGVASRGKLRGLSLPVTSSKRAAPDADEQPGKPESPPRKLTKLGPTRSESDSKGPSHISKQTSRATGNTTASTPTNYGFVNIDPTSPATTSSTHATSTVEWRRPQSLSHSRNVRLATKKPRRHTLQPLQVAAAHPARDYGVMPMTASIVGGYGHHDFGLASQISPIVPQFSGYDMSSMSSPTTKDFMQPMSASYDSTMFNTAHLPWASQPLTPSVASDHGSHPGAGDAQAFFPSVDGMMGLPSDLVNRTSTIAGAPSDANFSIMEPKFSNLGANLPALVSDDVGDHTVLTIPPAIPSLRIGKTPEMQFLIDYYDKVISPVIVAFDGPSNPYRSHILQLAINSDPLQHALAALAASNLRMRRAQDHNAPDRTISPVSDSSHELSVRRSSLAHMLLGGSLAGLPDTPRNEPSAEELHHKAQAIKGLNEHLADPSRRRDDSILASLLILCLYHICDTGVGKFKTQFAGVKKILALRGGSPDSKASNWLTIMFTWFDAMTASVNEREAQFSSDDLDAATSDEDEWGLENLAGCDRRLFKVVAELGRLNLLSQNKAVSPPPSPSPRNSNSPPRLPSPPATKDYYSMSNPTFEQGHYSDLRTTAQQAPVYEPNSPPAEALRSEFWSEWRRIRSSLQSWSFSPATPPPRHSLCPDADRQDLMHISESFRYSALLYTERLACPSVPSAHPSFQSLVTQALYHISLVKADVFLLWPLFITGTECVDPSSRQMVRDRVWGLQRDSGFFNNLSCLQLLEKTWRDDSPDSVGTPVQAPLPLNGTPAVTQPMTPPAVTGMRASDWANGGFRWRKAMDRTDGEYIVV